jgi:hypothetical protein
VCGWLVAMCSYSGDWKDNMRHGKVRICCSSGPSHSHFMHRSHYECSVQGTLTWTDGSVYEGEYDRGYRHGRGELRLSNGFSYSGSWDKNYMVTLNMLRSAQPVIS